MPSSQCLRANVFFVTDSLIDLPGPPPEFITQTGMSTMAATLIWHGIEPSTRKSYASATKSWEYFCAEKGFSTYPAQRPNLIEWVAQRTYGMGSPFMGKIAAKTLRVYMAAIRSIHVDRSLSVEVFTDPTLRRALDGTTSLNPQPHNVAHKQPISRETLKKIVTGGSTIPTIMGDSAFCLAFAGCFRIGELTYTER